MVPGSNVPKAPVGAQCPAPAAMLLRPNIAEGSSALERGLEQQPCGPHVNCRVAVNDRDPLLF